MNERMPYYAAAAILVAIAVTLVAYVAFASGNDEPSEAEATATATATQPASTATAVRPTATSPAVVAPTATPQASAPGQPSTPPSNDPNRMRVLAPIDGARVQPVGGGAVLRIQAGLPSGCAQSDGYEVQRAGTQIQVSVYNTIPKGDPICTAIYGMYEVSIPLDGLTAGQQYTVRVNAAPEIRFQY